MGPAGNAILGAGPGGGKAWHAHAKGAPALSGRP